jgi:hypothetical protein
MGGGGDEIGGALGADVVEDRGDLGGVAVEDAHLAQPRQHAIAEAREDGAYEGLCCGFHRPFELSRSHHRYARRERALVGSQAQGRAHRVLHQVVPVWVGEMWDYGVHDGLDTGGRELARPGYHSLADGWN